MGIWDIFRGSRTETPIADSAASVARHPNHKQHVRFAAAKQKQHSLGRFSGGSMSADAELQRDLVRLREASRVSGGDVGYVRRYFNMVQTHVVGENGLRLQSLVRDRDGKIDRDASRMIEQEFAEWGDRDTCEVGGKLSWVAAQELTAKTTAQDGDMLIRYHVDKSNPYGFCTELIESDYLDVSLNQQLRNGNRIVMGVELNQRRQPVAYHLLTNHPGDNTWSCGGRRYDRVPADEIGLTFPMWRPGQTRGVPWAHASLLELYQINGMREAQLAGAKIGAANMFFYERDPEQEVSDDFDEEGEFVQELEAGQSSVVPEGYKVNSTNYTQPAATGFQKDALRGSASGLDVNYNVLGNDYEGVSFSSLRQAVLEDREAWKRKQRWLIEDFGSPVFKRWLKMALLKNKLRGLSPADLAPLSKHKFMGRRWPWVDPLKDEQAAGEAMKNMTTSPLHILRDKGLDIDDVKNGWEEYFDAMGDVIERKQQLMPDKPVEKAKPDKAEQE